MEIENVRPYKFGKGASFKDEKPFYFGNLFELRKTTGPDQLVIGPQGRIVDHMIALAEFLPEPFCLLYVLMISRRGEALPGRYQSPYPLARAEAVSFLGKFRDYFEKDGRHNIWIMAEGDFHSIVYDHHEFLYAYGPIERYQQYLLEHGFKEGAIRIPAPHHHCYNQEFDVAEAQVLKHFEWIRFPLQDEHDY